MNNVGLLDVAQQVFTSGVAYRQANVPAVVDGQAKRIVDISIVALPDEAVAMIFDDVTEERQAMDLLTFQAERDGLTRLLNRSSFKASLEHFMDRSRPVSLLLLDLDGFKEVNDGLGHSAGDDLLVTVADRLLGLVADLPGAIVARLGGDEFAVAVPGSLRKGELLADTIVPALTRPVSLSTVTASVACSIGVAAFPDHANKASDLLRAADVAMYSIKGSGIAVAVAGSREAGDAVLRVDLARRVEEALSSKRFRLYLQPIVDLGSGQVVGSEGLARWVDPVDGVLVPDVFLDLLRVAGRLPSLTALMLEQAARLPMNDRFITVNICDQDLRNGDLFEEFKLSKGTSKPIWFEVSESDLALLSLEQLQMIQANGFRLAVDDFGTGTSSLGRLQQLPVDVVKLDPSLLAGSDQRSLTVLRSITDLAHGLGATVVAEGIEDSEMADRARSVGCDLGQGFYFAHPAALDDIGDLLARDGDLYHNDWPSP